MTVKAATNVTKVTAVTDVTAIKNVTVWRAVIKVVTALQKEISVAGVVTHVFTQRSVTAVTPAKVGCSTLQLQYSCYLISCYRARNVLGVVQRREYKSFSTYTAATWAETKTQCFLHVKLAGSLFAVKIFSWNCTSCQIEFSNFQLKLYLLSNWISNWNFSATLLSLRGDGCGGIFVLHSQGFF